jgi:hypothetical protein
LSANDAASMSAAEATSEKISPDISAIYLKKTGDPGHRRCAKNKSTSTDNYCLIQHMDEVQWADKKKMLVGHGTTSLVHLSG